MHGEFVKNIRCRFKEVTAKEHDFIMIQNLLKIKRFIH